MNHTIYLAAIPVIHYILLTIHRRDSFKTRIINYVLSIIYGAYIVFITILYRGALIGYSLSTIPMVLEIQLSIISVIDPLTITYWILTLIIYLYIVVDKIIFKEPGLLLVIASVTYISSSMDILLNALATSIVILHYVLTSHRCRYLLLFFIALNMLGYLLSNTVNSGLFVYYYVFKEFKQLLGVGLLLYVFSYFLVLAYGAKLYPLFRGSGGVAVRELPLVVVSTVALSRLLPSLMILYYDSFFNVFKYYTLAFSLINLIYYSLKILKNNTYLSTYEIGYLPLLLVVNTPFSFAAAVIVIASLLIHEFVKNRLVNDHWIGLSQIGFPFTPGFISKYIVISIIFLKMGVLPTVFTILSLVYVFVGAGLKLSAEYSFNHATQYFILIAVSTLLLLFFDILSQSYRLLFNLRLYRNIVLGV